MKEAILTVGPQASGKSAFCNRVVALDSGIVLVSRDSILVDLFGTVFLDSYSGGHYDAYHIMWKKIEEEVQKASSYKLILDTWNDDSQERKSIIKKLRDLGVERVVAWYFVTPVEMVSEWFWKKPGIAKTSDMRNLQGKDFVFFSEGTPARDYKLFHKYASEIDMDSFDEVVRINPLITTPEQILSFQTDLEI